MGKPAATVPTIGFNVETVKFDPLEFVVWVRALRNIRTDRSPSFILWIDSQDVSGQDKLRTFWRYAFPCPLHSLSPRAGSPANSCTEVPFVCAVTTTAAHRASFSWSTATTKSVWCVWRGLPERLCPLLRSLPASSKSQALTLRVALRAEHGAAGAARHFEGGGAGERRL